MGAEDGDEYGSLLVRHLSADGGTGGVFVRLASSVRPGRMQPDAPMRGRADLGLLLAAVSCRLVLFRSTNFRLVFCRHCVYPVEHNVLPPPPPPPTYSSRSLVRLVLPVVLLLLLLRPVSCLATASTALGLG